MSSIEWLNNLLFVENLLGIYRNYCSQKKIKKYFIIFQIFVQIIFCTIIIIGELYSLLGLFGFSQIYLSFGCFSASVYINSASTIATSICTSHAFISYLKSVSRVYERFKDDKKLIRSIKIVYRFSMSCILLCLVLILLRSVQILNKMPLSIDYSILVFISQTIIRMTIVLQNLIMFVVIMIVVYLFRCLNSLISAVQKNVGGCHISTDGDCDITSKQIQGWVEVYRDLANCCEKVTQCFGRLFFFSLLLTASTYILMLYQMCYMSALHITHYYEIQIFLFTSCCYALFTMLPIIAGQLVRNQGVKLHRGLARLYNTMIIDSNEAEAKMIKDFIRLLKKNPLQIKLLSKIPAGMYLLPAKLTFAVNYAIIMLQFNHII